MLLDFIIILKEERLVCFNVKQGEKEAEALAYSFVVQYI